MIRARHRRSAIAASAATSTSWRLRGISEPTLTISGGSPPPAARRPGSVPGGATVIRSPATPKPASSRRPVAALVHHHLAHPRQRRRLRADQRRGSPAGLSPASSPSG